MTRWCALLVLGLLPGCTGETDDSGDGAVNEGPSVAPYEARVGRDATLVIDVADLLATATDPEGDPVTVVAVQETSLNLGSVEWDGDEIVYTPPETFVGGDGFAYVIADDRGAAGTGSVSIEVFYDEEPVATDDTADTDFETPVTIDVLANDTGVGDTPLVVAVAFQADHGTATVQTDKTIRYTPDDDFSGEDSFTYRVTDRHGDFSEADVTVTVAPE